MPFMSGSIPSDSSVGRIDEGKHWRMGVKGKGVKTEISTAAIVSSRSYAAVA